MLNLEQTIISQYGNSPVLLRLIQNMNEYLDPRANFDGFYACIWNVETAFGYGLDVWGRIVNVSRVLQVQTGEIGFGFKEATTASAAPFNQGVFYAGAPVTTSYALSDDAYRTLIYAKALSNISNGSIPALNAILLKLFPGRGNCYVTDGGDMTMTYTFHFALTPVEQAIVAQSNVLAKPAGIVATVVII